MKNRTKKIISMALVSVMLASLLCNSIFAVSTSDFTDVKQGDWFYAYVDYAVQNGIINGTSSTTFSPGDVMTRAQFITILYRAFGTPCDGAANFVDVPSGIWYSNAVNWGVENRIIFGTSSTTFSPNDNVTRGQVATMIGRYLENTDSEKYLAVLPDNANIKFTDVNKFPAYAVTYIEKAKNYGLVSGYPSGEFLPENNMNRAEGATVLVRLLQKINEAKESTSDPAPTPAPAPTPSPEPAPTPEPPVSEHTHEYILTSWKNPKKNTGGYRVFTCVCGDEKTETFGPLGNSTIQEIDSDYYYLAVKVDSTETTEGYRIYTCDKTGVTHKYPIKKKGPDDYASYNSSINYGEARRAAIAYAESLGFMIDESLDWDNSSYYGSTWATYYSSTASLIEAIKKDIDYLALKMKEKSSVDVWHSRYNCLLGEPGTDDLTYVASAY